MTGSSKLAEAAARELNNELTIMLMGADAIAKSLPWSMPMTHPVWMALDQMRLAALRSQPADSGEGHPAQSLAKVIMDTG